jgi:hypothetical protein
MLNVAAEMVEVARDALVAGRAGGHAGGEVGAALLADKSLAGAAVDAPEIIAGMRVMGTPAGMNISKGGRTA